ncbi:MAG TPA: PilN domain-containing protein [Candidatus Omnitrophota bacterium]|nr:PilN domain-containing protein [Candidatus Omnitrophota bacterium]
MRTNKEKQTTVVEITESYVRFLQAHRGADAAPIVFDQEKEFPVSSEEEAREAISQFFSSHRKKRGEIIAVIPRRQMILKQLKFPSSVDEELRGMVQLQAVQNFPYAREDMVWDCIVLDKEPLGFTRVLVLAVHRQALERHLRIFHGAGLELDKLALSSWGLFYWYFDRVQHLGRSAEDTVALLNIDRTHSEICFWDRGGFCFSRSIPAGENDLLEERIPAFKKQLISTMEIYRKEQMGKTVDRFLLVSSLPEVSLLAEELKKDLSVAVETMAPSSWPAMAGLASCESAKIMNFMPEEIKRVKDFKKRKNETMKTLACFLIMLVATSSAFGVHIGKDWLFLKQLQIEQSQIKPVVKKIEERKKQLRFMKDQMALRIQMVDFLSELFRLTPEGVFLSSLSLNREGFLLLQGFTQDGWKVNVFQEKLLSAVFLKNVTLQYSAKQKSYDTELTHFQISCQILRNAR